MNFLPEKIASINKSIYPFGYTLGMKGLNVNVIKILMCPLQKRAQARFNNHMKNALRKS